MIVVTAASIGLIIFVSFIAARLIRTRTAGMSIRMQIFLALAMIVGAFAFGLGLMVLDRVKARADLVGGEAAMGEARAIAALVSAEMESKNATLAEVAERLGRADTPATRLNITLFEPDGRVVLTSGRAPDEAGTVSRIASITVHGEERGRVRVVKPTLVIRQTLEDFSAPVLIISLLLGMVSAGAAALIGGTIGRPIEDLTRFAERVSQGDRRAPPPPGYGREVARLNRSLDSMRRQLQGRPFVETFAADLSHELKNPVAAIRASAEVLHDGALQEPEEAERFVNRILEATKRIEALLGDLLSLARLEARGIHDAESIDLGRQADQALAFARERGLDVALEVKGTVNVRGEGVWLGRAIENLVENAHLHGNDGTVTVRVWRDGEDVRCSVSNPGRVAKGVKDRIFRRFVTTRADRGGTGLGLAIVRAVVEAHGGEAECVALGPPEVSFQITLPAA